MPTEIQLDAYPDLRLLGEVSRVVPTVDRSKATLLVKVTFKERDARVLPDMSAKVAFLSRPPAPDERKPVTVLRPEAIVKRGDRNVVFVLGDRNTVREVGVGTPRKLGDLMQVATVKPGDKVVLNPPGKVRDGDSVAIAKK
jgi:HlyD family secretion protein